jgi:hypothetical protein
MKLDINKIELKKLSDNIFQIYHDNNILKFSGPLLLAPFGIDTEYNKQTRKELYEKYKDRNKETQKKYYEKNKEKYKEYQEEYREINKEKIQEHYKENWSIKMTCECGCIFTTKNKIRHDKTKMHLNLLNRHNNKFE